MTKIQLFPNFQTTLPSTSPFVLHPYENEAPNDPETQKALRVLGDQIFKENTVSRQFIYNTKFIVLLRPLEYFPEYEGKKSIYGYDWFAGHYDWGTLLTKALEIQVDSTEKQALFMVPTLGQSLQGSKRHDLTYNVFVAPENLPPFTQLCERRPLPDDGKEVDLDLDKKSDPIYYRSLESLDLEWKHTYTFDKTVVPDLQDYSFKVFIFGATNKFVTGLSRMPEDQFNTWYDIVMGNFLPSIPHPTTGDHVISTLPLVIVDPVECTPPCYRKLMDTIDKVNNTIGGEERAIINTVKYWQISPVQISEALPIFINNGLAIPEKNKEFNLLFADLFVVVREFIVDEIFANFLHIKRKLVPDNPDDPEERDIAEEPAEWRGAQAEIDWELDYFDEKAKKLYGSRPEVMAVLKELKDQIPFWFERDDMQTIFNEFKVSITNALKQMIQSESFSAYMEISKKENSNPARNEWLKKYYNSEVSFCMWPTIYKVTGPLEKDTNELLVKTETELLSTAHVSIPGVKGIVLPPK
ncbi:hypothetical protein TVAG_322620 [Trichomonas vaginalis G3]|uniref:Uncharacterized protein n=1 Tax=Trichomonas vaginalis (strain ATCC PRA-98 / G3) TaxID=412133 RepID=A2EL14_TRIV3|nr:hypothetical protein TVAGG3_0234640 [Trichomonas vaginalis G3]EAY06642.1 hypothetical protein TVAG_322620 [Trichomonas vaginalis G3]KAI5552899.1 hypothetical protein TVAGG3_0234640 [Trichomonas vaginalis G3]|eukprot:XP_001318865.1 hypothetical protein [Trichomonas vaginalis G3]